MLLLFSQLDFLIGSFLPKSDADMAKGFTGWSLETGTANVYVSLIFTDRVLLKLTTKILKTSDQG